MERKLDKIDLEHMKTIYDLVVGDSYWRKIPTGKVCIMIEDNDSYIDNYQHDMMYGNVYLTKEDCQKSIDYDVALAKINKRVAELEQEVELLEDYQYIDLHESKHRGLTIHSTHYIDCAKSEKYAREKLPYKLCFDYNVCVSLIEELPEECKIVLGVD